MVVTRKFFQSCGISTPLYGSLHGNCLKVAEYEYHCIVVTRKLFQSSGMSTPLYGSYKQPVSKLRNVKTIVWQLQENCLKVAEYENHSMVVTRKSFQSCGMWKALYGSYREIVLKLRNLNTTLWQLQGNSFKVAECQKHCMVVTRKLF